MKSHYYRRDWIADVSDEDKSMRVGGGSVEGYVLEELNLVKLKYHLSKMGMLHKEERLVDVLKRANRDEDRFR
jgi:hypothetical protein